MINSRLLDWEKGIGYFNCCPIGPSFGGKIELANTVGYGRVTTSILRIPQRQLAAVVVIGAVHAKQRLVPMFRSWP